jgi:hypothetical protein
VSFLSRGVGVVPGRDGILLDEAAPDRKRASWPVDLKWRPAHTFRRLRIINVS